MELPECLDFYQANNKHCSAVTIITHGLNNKPDSMNEIVHFLLNIGSDVILVKLFGHFGNSELIESSPLIWKKNLLEGYEFARSLLNRGSAKKIFFLGFSLGALVNLDLLLNNSSITYHKMVLISPPIFLKWNWPLSKLIFFLNGKINLPSMTPKSYRANRAIPVRAYQNLFEVQKAVNHHNLGKLNFPTLIFLDPKDEFVNCMELVNRIKTDRIDNWQINLVNSPHKAFKNYHHLIVDNYSMGEDNWREFKRKVRDFFC